MTKKFKDLINEASEEQLLNVFLKSRGINPLFVTKDTKISHAKSSSYLKWKNDHQNIKSFGEEIDSLDEVDINKLSPAAQAHVKRGRVVQVNLGNKVDRPSLVKKDKPKKASFLQKIFAGESVQPEETIPEAKTIQGTALDKFRQAAAERARKHDDIERAMKARHAAGKEDMKGSIDRLEKQLNKEESGASKETETKFHKKLDKLVHSTFGKRKDEMKKEEVVNEMDKTQTPPGRDGNSVYDPDAGKKQYTGKPTTANKAKKDVLKLLNKSFNKEETEHKVGDSVTVNSKFFGKQKGKVTKVDNQSIHVQRNDKKTSEKYPHDAVVKEDIYQDSQAATQTVFDGGNNTDDISNDPKSSRKSQMSKSARIIKALYKKKGIKEGADGQSGGGMMYDKEKADKTEFTYGKKPAVLKAEKGASTGDDAPSAAAILTGGKTLTGQTRDTLEIDPLMKKPGPPINQTKKD